MVAVGTVMLVQMWRRYKFEIVVTMTENVMLVQMWCRYEFEIAVALGGSGGCFSHCNAGADVGQGKIWKQGVVAFHNVMLVQMW